MNIIKDVINRIEKYRTTNKNPCKNYATEAAAEKATAKVAQEIAEHHDSGRPAQYVVFYVESWGRWVGAINVTELLQRQDARSGYLGFGPRKGFYTF